MRLGLAWKGGKSWLFVHKLGPEGSGKDAGEQEAVKCWNGGSELCSAFHNICSIAAQPQIAEIRSLPSKAEALQK